MKIRILLLTAFLIACASNTQTPPAVKVNSEEFGMPQKQYETYTQCSAYYMILEMAVLANKVNDISRQDAKRAWFAFDKQIMDKVMSSSLKNYKLLNEKNTSVVANKMGRMTPEWTKDSIAQFRNKYDRTCEKELRTVWCESYRDRSPSACAHLSK